MKSRLIIIPITDLLHILRDYAGQTEDFPVDAVASKWRATPDKRMQMVVVTSDPTRANKTCRINFQLKRTFLV